MATATQSTALIGTWQRIAEANQREGILRLDAWGEAEIAVTERAYPEVTSGRPVSGAYELVIRGAEEVWARGTGALASTVLPVVEGYIPVASGAAAQAIAIAQGAQASVAAIAPNVRKNTFTATRAPLPSDDETQGYAVGSRWQSGGREWLRTAAGWEPVTRQIAPQQFGAVGADASPLLTAMFAASPAGSEVLIPAGLYRLNTPVTIPNAARIIASSEAVFDLSGAAVGAHAFGFSGTAGAYIPIMSGLTKGSQRIQVDPAFALSLSIGTVLKIRSQDVFDPGRTASKHGELQVVRDLTDAATGFVDLAGPLQATYTLTPEVSVYSMGAGLSWTGGQFIGKPGPANNQKAFRLHKCRDFTIRNAVMRWFDDRAFWLEDCMDGLVEGCTVREARPASTGYGVSVIDATQDITFRANVFENVRHAFSTNNQSNNPGIPRRILFEGNTVRGGAKATTGSMGWGDSVDTHAAAEDIWMIGNTIVGCPGQAINFESASGRIEENTIIGSAGTAISVHNESAMPGNIVVADNDVNGSGAQGVRIVNGSAAGAAPYATARVLRNRVRGASAIGVLIGLASTGSMRGVSVEGNDVDDCGQEPLWVQSCPGISVKNNRLRGAVTGNSVARIRGSASASFSGNTFVRGGNVNYRLLYLDTASTGALISGNVFLSDDQPITQHAVRLDPDCANPVITGNQWAGTAGLYVVDVPGVVQSGNTA